MTSEESQLFAGYDSATVGYVPTPPPSGRGANYAMYFIMFQGSQSEPRRKVKRSGDIARVTNEDSEFSSDTQTSNTQTSQHRHRTPKTIPRTKLTAQTPIEERVALNKLKQKLDFGDNKVC